MNKIIVVKKIYQCFFLALLILFLVFSYNFFDISFVNNLIESSLGSSQFYIALLIFLLRTISIVIPVIPGTYCAVISGYIYGIKSGLLLIFIADFISCSSSFLISRRFGRTFLLKLLGSIQMKKIENISQKYIENNFFLMTGFLMTSWFDFVCYAVGLTKISWKKFMPALILSILISDIPFVAGGYTLSKLKDVSFNQVLNGEVSFLEGPYLMILIISAFTIFGLGLLNIFMTKKS